ncbi:MAG: DUF2059 domain-containing protein [Waddliaceae bacterium]|jgi:uncharacterized protein|nr:DUF2059 domain-containing protein [Waddliaceae bacterium]MBT3579489.1 DUF2059 domain-containing protein [Waddliaceae bacterium]MBT4445562.1 DUF2059 domain-containing protein [Waddliaceae bacterium]MBT6928246.1 DUF2059 domain-containing protein [Waddliaceae bacterium]MBT7264591.1 DUF2059 domain-containing protein [Waddliaceae bacterium]
MKKIISILAFMLILTSFSYGQSAVEPEYIATYKKLFEVLGAKDVYKEIIAQTVTTFKQRYPDIERSLWDDFEKEFLEASLDDLISMFAPVYSKYLTQEDLEETIAFYQTPSGKKLVESTPMMVKECMGIGREWGMNLGQGIAQDWIDEQRELQVSSEKEL